MSVIRLEHIIKKFEKVVAVDDLCLDIEEGEFVSLLGPSGCGKTTTLRCIAGLEKPDSGEIWIKNQLVFSAKEVVFVPPQKRDLSMVFQNYAVWPHMTVFENVAFGLKTRRANKKEIEKRVKEALNLVGIGELSNRFPYQLSGGQQQRVALARALVVDPSVLLMDEPLSNLDARLRMLMRDELKRIHHEMRTTVVYVTHDQVEALALSTKVVVLKEGVIQQIADPVVLYEYPSNLFVAQFVGGLSINLLKADVQFVDSGIVRLRVDKGSLDIEFPEGMLEQGVLRGRQQVILGIRPEHVGVSDRGELEKGFEVISEQFIGSFKVVKCRKGNVELLIQAPGTAGPSFRYGDLIFPQVDISKVRLYDPESNAIIWPIPKS